MLDIECVTIDSSDPASLAEFWATLLGAAIRSDDEGDLWIERPGMPDLLFLPSTEPRVVKNRLHLDLRPDDQAAEVARAVALGATHIDIGQSGQESWVVLADPEGNEFCILRARQ